MKTTEDLTKEQIETFIEVIMANMKLELRKDSLVIVWQDGLKKYAGGLKLPKKTMSLIKAAKAERDAELRELMPVEHKEDYPVLNQIDDAYVRGFNKCLSQVKALLSPNNKEDGQN